ncbi:ribosome recycling factor [Candidatus Peribacteria bacterium RIFCSPLOWO2_12_FULL_55_15]|nr:MAG: ribosome recycling factor [Candidatus Peribacteria bacterium RIFCSPHIGHO2_01_FULL_54_22]OGJ62955.1 MAG: ribosome recycling factor [Candidatus Peribacteria bacterium RIFCSPHIGHO2_02_FULL_55_24]OGJ64857.1 MAG: ribosome recycling factor [Candidatus Peribacteria bacterium RIFCSPHIGHO2_12_FULL_54_10]OGJ69132.1 MAG: ribosome recycling factor [Candidatus Peribacteria bacterium RIFCSPLOWO2_02_FULL_55_36]OGJ70781.1 MAG: ribosome recycling factor [Candidatus Peribacteria bacterium RIFCSPLOWO2_12_
MQSFSQEAKNIFHHLQGELSKLQTGRANASLIEHIDVEAYGSRQPMKTLAGILVQDARTLVIQPWDPGILADIERAIQASPLGVSPVNDGTILRINLPHLTEERREQLKKIVHTLAEDARIAIRQSRQKAHDAIKVKKEEDVKRTLEKELQRELDKVNELIDETRKRKEEEVMKI